MFNCNDHRAIEPSGRAEYKLWFCEKRIDPLFSVRGAFRNRNVFMLVLWGIVIKTESCGSPSDHAC